MIWFCQILALCGVLNPAVAVKFVKVRQDMFGGLISGISGSNVEEKCLRLSSDWGRERDVPFQTTTKVCSASLELSPSNLVFRHVMYLSACACSQKMLAALFVTDYPTVSPMNVAVPMWTYSNVETVVGALPSLTSVI